VSGARQTLSVCCLANSPGPFLRAALAPLREIADEVLIAIGGTVSEEDLGCYGEIADRIFSIEFDFLERHLAWLHAQCRGDWILRLDGDEIPSSAMLAEVLAAIEDHRVSSVGFARRHPFPTVEHYLVQEPWYPDFQVRLVRNDGSLRFSGQLHTAAERTLPARMVEAPLYHLPFLLGGAEERMARAERYERIRPGLVLPAGLPLARAMRPESLSGLATAPTPADDRQQIEAALSASGPGRGSLAATPVSLRDMDAFWAGRVLPESAYQASIELIGTPVPFSPGERRPVYFRVRNGGSEEWGWDPSIGPYIHVVHRLLDESRTPLGDWQPSFFTEWVKPGATTVVPGAIEAPTNPGHYLLDVKIRHAPARLFGDAQDVGLSVRPGGAWA
jgi:hypothetical protein